MASLATRARVCQRLLAPLLALGAVAVGYFGAVDRTDRAFDALPDLQVASFPAATDLSVHEFVGKLPQSVQDPLCDQKEILTASLSDDFAETLESDWREQQVRMELWTSDLMGTWTLLHIDPVGLACIVESGFGWSDGMAAQDVLQTRPLS